jgi:MFS family permease
MASARPASIGRNAELTPRKRLVNVVSGSIGNLVEYFDWAIYAAFALYFAPAFFPEGDQTAQLLNNAAVFAVGFIFRPLGGWLQDRSAALGEPDVSQFLTDCLHA